ncbi:biotin-requiring enzyme domain-containing protein [Ditylenchus destructor]|uniref:Biotin-requiring enzyme domain-containing protein n=1 Tax=Ditylenchus destructor TaxID=166010 RepID=A0AAD4NNR0_9BILA|nr:biotin-requiring enzyme domain-containing protein [Ditylenchus destructor]
MLFTKIFNTDKALSETHIGGQIREGLAQPQFVSGDVATDFIRKNKEHLVTSEHPNQQTVPASKEPSRKYSSFQYRKNITKTFASNPSVNGPFNTSDFFRANHYAKRKVILDHSKKTPEHSAQVTILGDGHYLVHPANGTAQEVKVSNVARNVSKVNSCPVVSFSLESDGRKWQCEAVQLKDSVLVHSGNVTREWDIPADVASSALDDSLLSSAESRKKEARSPIPSVVEKIFIKVGDKVAKTQALATMTAMKMEFVISVVCVLCAGHIRSEGGCYVVKSAISVGKRSLK